MAACMMSLFEIQKDQSQKKRLATCCSTSAVVRSVKPKEDPCKQRVSIKKSLLPSSYGFDVDFVLQYCSLVAPSETASFLEALISDKENINPSSDIGVLCFNSRSCPFCSSAVLRSPEGHGRVECACGNTWCWRCVKPWDYCHLECSSMPSLTLEDIISFITKFNKPSIIKQKKPAVATRKLQQINSAQRPALQLLR